MAFDVLARWPQAVAGDVAKLAVGCIHPDDTQRPRFNEVCRALEGIQERYPASAQPSLEAAYGEASYPTMPSRIHATLAGSLRRYRQQSHSKLPNTSEL